MGQSETAARRLRPAASAQGDFRVRRRRHVARAAAGRPPAAQTARNELFASFQTDAPSCDRCGSITVRCGNCYLCYNCGNSMGCS